MAQLQFTERKNPWFTHFGLILHARMCCMYYPFCCYACPIQMPLLFLPFQTCVFCACCTTRKKHPAFTHFASSTYALELLHLLPVLLLCMRIQMWHQSPFSPFF